MEPAGLKTLYLAFSFACTNFQIRAHVQVLFLLLLLPMHAIAYYLSHLRQILLSKLAVCTYLWMIRKAVNNQCCCIYATGLGVAGWLLLPIKLHTKDTWIDRPYSCCLSAHTCCQYSQFSTLAAAQWSCQSWRERRRQFKMHIFSCSISRRNFLKFMPYFDSYQTTSLCTWVRNQANKGVYVSVRRSHKL